jgi:CDP-glucose 4,6-dehydratase
MARQPEVVGHAFNFSTEIQVSVLELTRLVLELMGSDLQPDIRNEARNEIRHQYLSAVKARQMLAWQPRYNLREALLETIEWYRSHLAMHRESGDDRGRESIAA